MNEIARGECRSRRDIYIKEGDIREGDSEGITERGTNGKVQRLALSRRRHSSFEQVGRRGVA